MCLTQKIVSRLAEKFNTKQHELEDLIQYLSFVDAKMDSKLVILLNFMIVQIVEKLKMKFHVLWSKKVVFLLLEKLKKTCFLFNRHCYAMLI